jgi:hypothetical protein
MQVLKTLLSLVLMGAQTEGVDFGFRDFGRDDKRKEGKDGAYWYDGIHGQLPRTTTS